jgi:tryptophanyl-tRNA synthetase
MLGFDEHRYAKLAIKVIERMDLDINVSAIFSRVLPGLNGHPKMSKSLKGSTIDVHTPKEEIKTTLKLQERNFARPREDSSYLFIEQVSLNEDLSVMELNEAYHDFDSKEWNKFIDTYIDTILVPILKRWPGKSNTHTNNVN